MEKTKLEERIFIPQLWLEATTRIEFVDGFAQSI
jgi:hypothetical protein